MSPEQQRIKIAEACGWKRDSRGLGWLSPSGEYIDLPDYLNDLNAAHEMENGLKPDDFSKYLLQLQKLTQSEHRYEVENRYALIHATSAQRCEAFLKTKGLWK